MSDRESQILKAVSLLMDAWLDAPELRLGQLLENVAGTGPYLDTSHICIFYLSDADLMMKLQEFRDNAALRNTNTPSS